MDTEANLKGLNEKYALKDMNTWRLIQETGKPLRLERTYANLGDFNTAIKYANLFAAIANAHNHHPKLTIEWGSIKVETWTHTTKNVTEKDILLAEAIEHAYHNELKNVTPSKSD